MDDKEELMARMLAERTEPPAIQGEIIHRRDFPSKLIRPRPVDVWLPEGYDSASGDRYPVIYMHDGQMMFNHITSPYAGLDLFWDVDKAITRLVRDGEIRPAIVASIWMADWAKGARGAEYMPQKPATGEVLQSMKATGDSFAAEDGGESLSADNYLKFIVEELKPFVDENFSTETDRDSTSVMGSSMGGLISAYAVAEYPEVFGRAACLSSHWNVGDGVVVEWLKDHLPPAGSHRIYFDHGTETYDAGYGPYQRRMDEVMRLHGYTEAPQSRPGASLTLCAGCASGPRPRRPSMKQAPRSQAPFGACFMEGEDWVTLRFDGADHSPRAWRERLHIPLKFLLER